MSLDQAVRIDTNFNTEKTIGADRTKLAIPSTEIKEMLENAIKDLNNKAYKANPTTKPVFRYNYKEKVVVIDVCVSKMLFHNNLEEATEADFTSFVERIRSYAYEKGLLISAESIKNASVWYLEYGKNILLNSKYSANSVLSRLGKALDKKGQTYEAAKYYSNIGNNGVSVALHTENKKAILYDKTTKEIFASRNHKNNTVYKQLLDKKLQVLRLELKYLKKASVEEVIGKKLGKKDITLADIWNSNLAHSIINDFWQEIHPNIPKKCPKKAKLIKCLNKAVKEGISIQDIYLQYADNALKNELGNILLKQILMPIESKISGKAQQQQYSALQKKCRKYENIFAVKNDYSIRQITEYIENFLAIRLTRSEDWGCEDQITEIRGKF